MKKEIFAVVVMAGIKLYAMEQKDKTSHVSIPSESNSFGQELAHSCPDRPQTSKNALPGFSVSERRAIFEKKIEKINSSMKPLSERSIFKQKSKSFVAITASRNDISGKEKIENSDTTNVKESNKKEESSFDIKRLKEKQRKNTSMFKLYNTEIEKTEEYLETLRKKKEKVKRDALEAKITLKVKSTLEKEQS